MVPLVTYLLLRVMVPKGVLLLLSVVEAEVVGVGEEQVGEQDVDNKVVVVSEGRNKVSGASNAVARAVVASNTTVMEGEETSRVVEAVVGVLQVREMFLVPGVALAAAQDSSRVVGSFARDVAVIVAMTIMEEEDLICKEMTAMLVAAMGTRAIVRLSTMTNVLRVATELDLLPGKSENKGILFSIVLSYTSSLFFSFLVNNNQL